MSSFQNKVYECSRQNATVFLNDKGTEWINEFKEGIKLDKGDTLRILGSFVNEAAQGDEIEITDDMEINIIHTPYIRGHSLATADNKTSLVDLGTFGDIAYTTDATGIEPPHFLEDPVAGPDGGVTQPLGSDTMYRNVIGTACNGIQFGASAGLNDRSRWNPATTPASGILDKSECAGITVDTSKNYGLFANNTVDNELYLGQIVKKFILPVADGIANRNRGADMVNGGMDLSYTVDTIRHSFEPLINDTTNYTKDQLGRFGGAPRAGMLIATVNLAGSYGWFDAEARGLYQINYGSPTVSRGEVPSLGIPNLIGGVESMIGKIIAVKPIKRVIYEFPTDTFEIYVTDWINPATIKKDVYRTTFPANEYLYANRSASSLNPVECIKFPHGCGQNDIGYNKNPAFNPINGLYNQYTPRINTRGRDTGSCPGYFTNTNTYGSEWAKPVIRQGSDDTSNANDSEFKYGFGQPWGLSFPYNGGQCCGLTSQGDTVNPTDQRANSYSIWYRDPPIGNPLDIALQIYDNEYDQLNFPPRPFAGYLAPTAEPQIMGGYICCNEEVMMDIVKNGQNLLTETNNGAAIAGHYPRVWFEWGYQNMPSEYFTRHFKDNSLSRDTSAPHNYDNDITSYYNRAQYDMCGKPDNKNYKSNNHNFGTIGVIAGTGGGVSTFAPQSNAIYGADSSPILLATATGLTNYGASVPANEAGAPYEYCGYNNALNSIHFQQKETGDTNLSRGNVITEITCRTTAVGTHQNINIECPAGVVPKFLNSITSQSLTTSETYIGRNSVYIDQNPVHLGGNNYSILVTFGIQNPRDGDKLFLHSSTTGGTLESGYGTNAKPWCSDMIMIKEYITKVKIDAGYYTKEQLGASINEVLHYRTNKYATEFGDKIPNTIEYNVPTSVGKLCEARGSEPSFITGNFVHSYIPEVTYGFTPVTSDNAQAMNLTASTKDLTDELLTYDFDGNFYNNDPNTGVPLPAYNGTTVRYVYEADTQGRTYFGKHLKLYSPPYLPKDSFNETGDQIHIIRLKGGALQADSQDATTKLWDISSQPRFAGMYESLRSQYADGSGTHDGTYSTFAYRCRGVNNVCSHGGGAKIFCGANNISVEFNDLANRFNIYNLFTPIRPHTSENAGKTDFDVGDAVPSAIINSKFTGDNDGLLSGTYISSLNGGAFTESEWGRSWVDNWKYDTESDTTIKLYGTNFLDALGYNSTQLSQYLDYGVYQPISQPYTYSSVIKEYGKVIRGDVKLTPAINGSNPFANNCLLINPVQQYFTQVESQDFFADDPPTLGTSPYYFIGSDLPINHFMGNETGTKLPVVGINARNFHSFGFSFDVGATSVEYTIDRPTTITSISTAIYDSNLKTPTNISKFSSVIYLLTKNNYVKTLDPQYVAQTLVNNARFYQSQQLQYFQPPIAGLRTEPPVNIPENYYKAQWNGSLLNPLDEDDSDSDI